METSPWCLLLLGDETDCNVVPLSGLSRVADHGQEKSGVDPGASVLEASEAAQLQTPGG